MHARALILVLLTACASANGSPKAPVRTGNFAGGSGETVETQTGPDPGMPSRTEVCPDETDRDECFVRVIRVTRCGGAAIARDNPRNAHPVYGCVCDRCRTDAHCGARSGGRCTLLDGNTCDHSLRICLYPDDVCFDSSTCNKSCMHAGDRAVCANPTGPPP